MDTISTCDEKRVSLNLAHKPNRRRHRPGVYLMLAAEVRNIDKADDIVLDQIRTVDKSRLVKHLGRLDELMQQLILQCLDELFAP